MIAPLSESDVDIFVVLDPKYHVQCTAALLDTLRTVLLRTYTKTPSSPTLRHPDLYGAIFSASPGAGYRPPDVMPTPLPLTYLVAGTQEPFFLENAARWAVALRDAGADVVMSERDAGHDDSMWRGEFPLMVEWAFGG
jgi:hypothetical protein